MSLLGCRRGRWCGRRGSGFASPAGTRRCIWRCDTATCVSSMRSSAPAHRWTPRTSAAGGPFGRSARPLGAVGAGQCRRRCLQFAQKFVALGGGPRPACRLCAHQRRRTAEHPGQQQQRVGLLERSARPLVRSARFRFCFARRDTPLHLAVINGNAAVTAALLGAGADASIKNRSWYAAPHTPHGRPPQPQKRCPQEDGRAMGKT